MKSYFPKPSKHFVSGVLQNTVFQVLQLIKQVLEREDRSIETESRDPKVLLPSKAFDHLCASMDDCTRACYLFRLIMDHTDRSTDELRHNLQKTLLCKIRLRYAYPYSMEVYSNILNNAFILHDFTMVMPEPVVKPENCELFVVVVIHILSTFGNATFSDDRFTSTGSIQLLNPCSHLFSTFDDVLPRLLPLFNRKFTERKFSNMKTQMFESITEACVRCTHLLAHTRAFRFREDQKQYLLRMCRECELPAGPPGPNCGRYSIRLSRNDWIDVLLASQAHDGVMAKSVLLRLLATAFYPSIPGISFSRLFIQASLFQRHTDDAKEDTDAPMETHKNTPSGARGRAEETGCIDKKQIRASYREFPAKRKRSSV